MALSDIKSSSRHFRLRSFEEQTAFIVLGHTRHIYDTKTTHNNDIRDYAKENDTVYDYHIGNDSRPETKYHSGVQEQGVYGYDPPAYIQAGSFASVSLANCLFHTKQLWMTLGALIPDLTHLGSAKGTDLDPDRFSLYFQRLAWETKQQVALVTVDALTTSDLPHKFERKTASQNCKLKSHWSHLPDVTQAATEWRCSSEGASFLTCALELMDVVFPQGQLTHSRNILVTWFNVLKSRGYTFPLRSAYNEGKSRSKGIPLTFAPAVHGGPVRGGQQVVGSSHCTCGSSHFTWRRHQSLHGGRGVLLLQALPFFQRRA